MTTKVTITHSQDHYPSKVRVVQIDTVSTGETESVVAELKHGESTDVLLFGGRTIRIEENMGE